MHSQELVELRGLSLGPVRPGQFVIADVGNVALEQRPDVLSVSMSGGGLTLSEDCNHH